jgi:hypothetical protein
VSQPNYRYINASKYFICVIYAGGLLTFLHSSSVLTFRVLVFLLKNIMTQNLMMWKWLYIFTAYYNSVLGGELSLSLVSVTHIYRAKFWGKGNVEYPYTFGDCILTMNFPTESCSRAHGSPICDIHFIVCCLWCNFICISCW